MPTDKIFLRDQMVFDPARGTFDVVHQARAMLENASAEILYHDAHGNPRRLALRGDSRVAYGLGRNLITASRADQNVELIWSATLGDELTFQVRVKNHSPEPIRVDELHVLVLDAANDGRVNLGPARDWTFFTNGWQSWSATFGRHTHDSIFRLPRDPANFPKHVPYPPAADTLSSDTFTILATRPPSLATLLGFITTANQLSEIRLKLADTDFARLDAVCYADGVAVEPGATYASETLLVHFGEPLKLYDHHAERLAQTMGARFNPRTPRTGWCTWYYYYGENTEQDVLNNVAKIRAENLPLELVLIDDGYQTAIGDWTSIDANKFPRGMKAVAEEIKRAGLVPGIWLAPFGARHDSGLARAHPDWLVHDEHGAPLCAWQHWGEDVFALDTTHPQVQEHLSGLFRTLAEDWGFEFFKIDFVFAAALAGERYARNTTRAEAYRRGLEVIREAVGDKFVLGCGAPLGASIGLVDAMRIGSDVHLAWDAFERDLNEPATLNAIRNILTRAPLHNRLWVNDPDCALIRANDIGLKLDEELSLLSIIGLSGGMALSSDDLTSIRRSRLKYLRQILPPTTLRLRSGAATPLDLFENETPRIFALPCKTDWGEWLVVSVSNWEDKPREVEVELAALGLVPRGEYHAYEFWSQKYLGVVKRRLTLPKLRAHATALLLFKRVSKRVELLTTTFHIAQGLVEVLRVERVGATLVVDLAKEGIQRGEVLFAVPPSRKITSARVNGNPARVHKIARGVYAVRLRLEGKARVEVEARLRSIESPPTSIRT